MQLYCGPEFLPPSVLKGMSLRARPDTCKANHLQDEQVFTLSTRRLCEENGDYMRAQPESRRFRAVFAGEV